MPGKLADSVSERYKIPMRYRSLNDMEIWDPNLAAWRKVMGTGATTLGDAAGSHGSRRPSSRAS
nr:hypothetical protein [Candidatus Freyrarchaeum guaymaensis]